MRLLAVALVLVVLYNVVDAQPTESSRSSSFLHILSWRIRLPVWMQRTRNWITNSWRDVKDFFTGRSSWTVNLFGREFKIKMPRIPSNMNNIRRRGKKFEHTLKEDSATRLLFAIYLNVAIFLSVYAYLIVRNLTLTLSLQRNVPPPTQIPGRSHTNNFSFLENLRRGDAENVAAFSNPIAETDIDFDVFDDVEMETGIDVNDQANGSKLRKMAALAESDLTPHNYEKMEARRRSESATGDKEEHVFPPMMNVPDSDGYIHIDGYEPFKTVTDALQEIRETKY